LLVRNVVSPIGGTLLVLGLIGLYTRQSEASGVVGLLGFLFALFGTVLALAGNAWANLLAYFGWALFGVASLQARVYPPAASMLLIIGALIAAPFSILLAGASPILTYLGVASSIVFNGAVAWLGLVLVRGEALRPGTPQRGSKSQRAESTRLSDLSIQLGCVAEKVEPVAFGLFVSSPQRVARPRIPKELVSPLDRRN